MNTAEITSEAELQDTVLELAGYANWLRCHFRPARTKDGWRTALAGDKGFPDLVLVKGQRFLIVELKSESGKVSAAQRRWILALQDADVDVRIWRPSDLDEIERTLTGGAS